MQSNALNANLKYRGCNEQ